MKPRVLLVDGDAAAREGERASLVAAGYDVLAVAADGDALGLVLGQEAPQLIIVDLDRPTVRGWRLVDVLRAYTRLAAIPVLAVTARHGAAVAGDACSRVLRRPFAPTALVEAVKEVVGAPSSDDKSRATG